MIQFCRKHAAVCAISLAAFGLAAGAALAQGAWQAWGGPPAAAPVASQAYFPVSRCINMGNALEAPVEGTWGYAFRQQDFARVRNAGFDTVRIPIKWSAHAAASPPYRIDPAFFARTDQIMTWAVSAGLNVIINVHHYDELYTDPDRHEPRLDALWAQIAGRYRNAPPGVMFEVINEPREAFSGPRVNAAQARAVSIIRQTNPTRTVILTGDQWGSLEGMDNLQLPRDPFVVATVHYYGPYEFTHQGAEWLPNPPPPGRNWPLPGEIAQLNRDMDSVARWQNRLGVPVLLGEYGVDAAVPDRLRAAWTRDVTAALDARGIAWCYFNFSGGFPIYNVASESWNRPILQALGLSPGR